MLATIQEFLQSDFGGTTVQRAGLALLAFVGGFVLAAVLKKVLKRPKLAAAKTSMKFDDVLLDALVRPLSWGAVLGGLFVGTRLLGIHPDETEVHQFLSVFFKGGSILLLVWFGIRISDRACAVWAQKAALTESKIDDQMVPVVRGVMKVFLVLLGGTFFLQNLGYSVGSLLAGLGLGGAALALASKDLLSNVFGAVAIFWDRSFEVGDWVQIGDVEGIVEEVGLRTTRIRTFSNSLVTVPNASLTTSAINNWTRMKKRRGRLTLHLALTTPPNQVNALVQSLRELLAKDPAMVPDDIVVNFDTIDEYSLCIFIQFFTVSVAYKDHQEAKQLFLLKALEQANALGVQLVPIPVAKAV